MVTVIVAVACLALGLIGVLPGFEPFVGRANDVLAGVPILVELGLTFDSNLAFLLLLLAPVLLIIGSLFRGI